MSWPARVRDCEISLSLGIGHLRRGDGHDALVYFELLERSGFAETQLPQLIAEARLCSLPHHLQDEIDRRDRLYVELHDSLQAEVDRRDELLTEVKRELQAQVDLRDAMLATQQAEHVEAVAVRDRIIEELRKPPLLARLGVRSESATAADQPRDDVEASSERSE